MKPNGKPLKMASKSSLYRTVVTFEGRGDPVCVRGEIIDSSLDSVARKAVFRALPAVGRLKWESVVVVIDLMEDASRGRPKVLRSHR